MPDTLASQNSNQLVLLDQMVIEPSIDNKVRPSASGNDVALKP